MLIDGDRDLIDRKTLELLYYSIKLNLENILFESQNQSIYIATET